MRLHDFDSAYENMDHSKDGRAVPELKAALTAHSKEIQSATDDQVYDIIDRMMTRIAKSHGISGQKLHDMWVDKYGQIPDTWVMKIKENLEKGVTEEFTNYQGLRTPKNEPGVNLFPGKDIVGRRVYHCTNNLEAIKKSGGLKPRRDATGEREYGRLSTDEHPFIPVIGVWFSVGKPDWVGKHCLSFVIEPTDQVYVAYTNTKGLYPNVVLNPIALDRLTVEDQQGVAEATGDERFDSMMGQIQREPTIPDSQMPPTDVRDLHAWAVKNRKPYHKIFAEWAMREGYKSVAPALQKAGNLDSDAIDYWTPDVWKIWYGPDSEMPQGYSRQRIPEELRDYLETVFDAYDRIVFDWPTEYRQIKENKLNEDAVMGKIEQSGQIVRILKKQHTVPFSSDKDWLLIDTDPAKGNKGLGIKWVPATTRFEWVRPYRDTVDENFADGRHPGRRGLAKHLMRESASEREIAQVQYMQGECAVLALTIRNMNPQRFTLGFVYEFFDSSPDMYLEPDEFDELDPARQQDIQYNHENWTLTHAYVYDVKTREYIDAEGRHNQLPTIGRDFNATRHNKFPAELQDLVNVSHYMEWDEAQEKWIVLSGWDALDKAYTHEGKQRAREYAIKYLGIDRPAQDVAENFADGKNPGRKGLAKRSGVDTKASVSSLRNTAKHSSGEKQRMAHWLANMKSGRAKANKK